jgi:hypothetical protein
MVHRPLSRTSGNYSYWVTEAFFLLLLESSLPAVDTASLFSCYSIRNIAVVLSLKCNVVIVDTAVDSVYVAFIAVVTVVDVDLLLLS